MLRSSNSYLTGSAVAFQGNFGLGRCGSSINLHISFSSAIRRKGSPLLGNRPGPSLPLEPFSVRASLTSWSVGSVEKSQVTGRSRP